MRLLTLLFSLLFSITVMATKPLLYVIEIKGEISASTTKKVSKGFNSAIEMGAEYLILHLNTYGGAVDAADSIRSALLRSPIPTAVYIDNQAVSAGALISIACDSIYMKKGGTIGAATVVNQTGEKMPDKYQSFMRAMMRSTAEAKGRDPLLAEAMVDPTVTIPGVVDSSRVLSFTAEEAIKHNFCEAIVTSIEEAAIHFTSKKREEITIVRQKLSPLDRVVLFLLSPLLQGLLLMIIIGGIYFELQTPGVGFPSIAALSAALLYFLPLYIEGLAQHWEIALFVIGLILLLLEIFVIPGFGVAGISGIILIVVGLSFAMIDNNHLYYEGTLNFRPLIKSFSIVVLSSFLALLSSIFLAGKLLNSPNNLFSRLSLQTSLEIDEGFVVADSKFADLIGKEGVVSSDLRPAGKIEIEGRWYEASLENGMATRGSRVVVTRYEGGRVYCEIIS